MSTRKTGKIAGLASLKRISGKGNLATHCGLYCKEGLLGFLSCSATELCRRKLIMKESPHMGNVLLLNCSKDLSVNPMDRFITLLSHWANPLILFDSETYAVSFLF